jgi:hypothetical protein
LCIEPTPGNVYVQITYPSVSNDLNRDLKFWIDVYRAEYKLEAHLLGLICAREHLSRCITMYARCAQ